MRQDGNHSFLDKCCRLRILSVTPRLSMHVLGLEPLTTIAAVADGAVRKLSFSEHLLCLLAEAACSFVHKDCRSCSCIPRREMKD